MFNKFSTRSRQVLFAARFKAGERGATMIDTDDFLVGLILEDQGLFVKSLFPDIEEGPAFFEKGQPHVPLLSAEAAADLLTNLRKILLYSEPVPLTTEIPLSPSLERVFDQAQALQAQFGYSNMEPLHFLAAILKEDSSEGPKLLQRSGITLESVLSALGGTGQN